MSFECVRDLPGLPPDVLIVPVTGHTRGHCAIAVRESDGGCSIAATPTSTKARWIRRVAAAPRAWICSGARSRSMAARGGATRSGCALARDKRGTVRVFCAHDPAELARYGTA
jgi:glyoxylase-like metal-dependent hydrolase (beta-lactamase superfamily II)